MFLKYTLSVQEISLKNQKQILKAKIFGYQQKKKRAFVKHVSTEEPEIPFVHGSMHYLPPNQTVLCL